MLTTFIVAFILGATVVGLAVHLAEKRAMRLDMRAQIKRENMRRIAKLRLR